MNCAHNCKHQPCPAPMSCGVGAFPVIDESLLRRPLEARSRHDDMTYSGPFQGHGIPLYQANSDGSDPHEGAFDWINTILRNALSFLAIWVALMVVCGAAGYFVAKLSF